MNFKIIFSERHQIRVTFPRTEFLPYWLSSIARALEDEEASTVTSSIDPFGSFVFARHLYNMVSSPVLPQFLRPVRTW